MAKNTVVSMRPMELRFTTDNGHFSLVFPGTDTLRELAKKFKTVETYLRMSAETMETREFSMEIIRESRFKEKIGITPRNIGVMDV